MDREELVKQTLDQIPNANANAKRIVGLVKKGGRITGYQLSGNSIGSRYGGQIDGVGIAHRGDAEYLKSIVEKQHPTEAKITTSAICPQFLPRRKDNNLTVSTHGTLSVFSLFIVAQILLLCLAGFRLLARNATFQQITCYLDGSGI